MTISKKCLVCPLGCQLTISKSTNNTDEYQVSGNKCNRGKDYGIKSLTEPSRILTSRVLLKNGPMSRLPVKTSHVVPDYLVEDFMEIIKSTEVQAPVKVGQVIIKGIKGTSIDLIAARKVTSL